MTGIKNMEQAAVLTLKEQVAYQPGQVVSKTLAQNDVFGTIEAVKTVSDAFLPVSGEMSNSMQPSTPTLRSSTRIPTARAGS